MNKDLFKFSEYLKVERNYSEYTIKNYVLDIEDFILWCKDNKIDKYKVHIKRLNLIYQSYMILIIRVQLYQEKLVH
mgnify:CR=1 FL=1